MTDRLKNALTKALTLFGAVAALLVVVAAVFAVVVGLFVFWGWAALLVLAFSGAVGWYYWFDY